MKLSEKEYNDAFQKAKEIYNNELSSDVAKAACEEIFPQLKNEPKLIPENNCYYVCIKDFYAGGKKQCSKGDVIQAKNGMYIMGRKDISEWFRKANVVEALRYHLANTPKEQLEAEWKELEPWGNIGPTVEEYLYGNPKSTEFNYFDNVMFNNVLSGLKYAYEDLCNNKSFDSASIIHNAYYWMKERFEELHPIPNQKALTKKDKEILNNILNILKKELTVNVVKGTSFFTHQTEIDWLIDMFKE